VNYLVAENIMLMMKCPRCQSNAISTVHKFNTLLVQFLCGRTCEVFGTSKRMIDVVDGGDSCLELRASGNVEKKSSQDQDFAKTAEYKNAGAVVRTSHTKK
jgi:hypothetical protein